MKIKINKSIQRMIQCIIIVVIFFFLIRTLVSNWSEVRAYSWKFNYPFLISSGGIVVLTLFFLITLWRLVLLRLGSRLSFRKAFRIWFISSLGRYVPGKIWQILGMIYLSQRERIPAERSTTSAILAQVFSIIPGVILALVTIIPLASKMSPWLYLSLPLVAAGVVVTYPPFLERTVNFFCQKLKRPTIHFEARFTDSLRFMLFYLLSWFLYGFAFFLFVRSATPISWQNFFAFPGIFAGAYLLGLLMIFVPGGLGVREGAMAYLLSFYFPLSVATAIALASRLWLTIIELICVGIALIPSRK